MVLATLDRPGTLPGLVDAVLADPGTLELVVVVDGPDDRSRAVLADLAATRPRLRPVGIEHRGQLGALDEGVRRAAGDVVVLLDDDVVPAPGTIAGHAARHAARQGLVVAGPMPVAAAGRGAPVGTRLYAAEYLSHMHGVRSGAVNLLDVLWTGNVSLRREDCLRVGLASPTFRAHYHADTDLGFRLAAAGLTGCFDPSLAAAHHHWRDDRAFLRDAARQGAGRVELHRAHPGRLGPFRRDELVADLPAPLRRAVAVAGGTRAGRPVAAGLMAAGGWCARIGWERPELVAAKVARRVMQWRGSVEGDATSPRAPATRRSGPRPGHVAGGGLVARDPVMPGAGGRARRRRPRETIRR